MRTKPGGGSQVIEAVQASVVHLVVESQSPGRGGAVRGRPSRAVGVEVADE